MRLLQTPTGRDIEGKCRESRQLSHGKGSMWRPLQTVQGKEKPSLVSQEVLQGICNFCTAQIPQPIQGLATM